MIKIHDMHKSYGSLKAVDGISLEVPEGALFAFLGPNGAGKSTTINVLCTLLSKDTGEVTLNGHLLGRDDDAIRHDIGVVFQKSFLDDLLSVRENLASRGAFYAIPHGELAERIETLARQLSLGEFLDRPYGKLSGGQRRRADIARALINHPRILFLDEPTTGLDPQTRQAIWTYIDGLRAQHHMTIFLTTHYMEEAARCDEVCIIDHGKILELGTPSRLKLKYAPTLLKLRGHLKASDLAAFTYPHSLKNGGYEVVVPDSMAALPILEALKASLESFEVVEGTMDAVFLALTGNLIREDAE